MFSRSRQPPACLVCGEHVLYHNFGTLACNGCAAFFRRTILQRKTYVCRQSPDCDIYLGECFVGKSHSNRVQNKKRVE